MTAPDTTHRDQLAAIIRSVSQGYTSDTTSGFMGGTAGAIIDPLTAADAILAAGWAPTTADPRCVDCPKPWRLKYDGARQRIAALEAASRPCSLADCECQIPAPPTETQETPAEPSPPSTGDFDLPGMWGKADLSGGWADSEGARDAPPTTAPVCDYCGGPHDQGYDGCPEYDAEVAEAEATASVAAPTPPTAEEEESFDCEPDDLKGVHVYDPTLEPTPPTTGKWSEAERGDMGR